jgi:probable phosphoglycerate mutase
MRLLLIRHGQTPANVLGQLDTARPGPGLTELGARQAAEIPDALANERVDALVASTLLRTQLTAAPLAGARGLEVEVRPGLHEIEAGDLESRTHPDSGRL